MVLIAEEVLTLCSGKDDMALQDDANWKKNNNNYSYGK